jgi:hypothetical protein
VRVEETLEPSGHAAAAEVLERYSTLRSAMHGV